MFKCVRVDLYTRESYAFHPFLLPRCPYEKAIFISVDRGEALCSRVKNEHQRKSKKKNEGEKRGKRITSEGKGEVGEPGSSFSLSSRLRLFRLGGYRCNQVHALFRFRSIPRDLQRERRYTHRHTPFVFVDTRIRIQVYILLSIYGSLFVEERTRRRKKSPPRYVGRSLIMSDRESVILKTIMVSTGVIYISLSAVRATALPTFTFFGLIQFFCNLQKRTGRPPTRFTRNNDRPMLLAPFHDSLTTSHSAH